MTAENLRMTPPHSQEIGVRPNPPARDLQPNYYRGKFRFCVRSADAVRRRLPLAHCSAIYTRCCEAYPHDHMIMLQMLRGVSCSILRLANDMIGGINSGNGATAAHVLPKRILRAAAGLQSLLSRLRSNRSLKTCCTLLFPSP